MLECEFAISGFDLGIRRLPLQIQQRVVVELHGHRGRERGGRGDRGRRRETRTRRAEEGGPQTSEAEREERARQGRSESESARTAQRVRSETGSTASSALSPLSSPLLLLTACCAAVWEPWAALSVSRLRDAQRRPTQTHAVSRAAASEPWLPTRVCHSFSTAYCAALVAVRSCPTVPCSALPFWQRSR